MTTADISIGKSILLYHCARSGELKQIFAIQDFLVDEIQTKKCNKRQQLFYPNSENTNYYFENNVGMGLKIVSNANKFPLDFQSALDSVLFKIMRPYSTIKENSMVCLNLPIAAVYFNRNLYPRGDFAQAHDNAMKFNQEDWTLSSLSKELTAEDVDIILRFRDKALALMDDCISIVKYNGFPNKFAEKLVKERQRYARVCEQVL